MGYIGNFIVYTLAMVGVIVVALLVFKNATSAGNLGRKSKYLQLIDTMPLEQRKNLYIVSTGREQFLIAGDIDKTTLISKLEGLGDDNFSTSQKFKDADFSKQDFKENSKIGIRSSLLEKIRHENKI